MELKDKGMFPDRWKMKVVESATGKVLRTVKSKNFDYILSEIEKEKKKYKPDEVEFMTVVSRVLRVSKPRFREFLNVPDDAEFWGINSSNEYYTANADYSKITKLKEVK